MHHTLSHAPVSGLFPVHTAEPAIGTIMVVTTLFVVAGMTAGMFAERWGSALPRAARPIARFLAAAGRWPSALTGAAVVGALGAAGQWWLTRGILDRAFLPTEAGWDRIPPSAQDVVHDAASLGALAATQSTAATCIACLGAVVLLSVGLDRSFAGRTARARALLVAGALVAPVLAACASVWAAVGSMQASPAELAIWSTWHSIEAGKWAIAGVAACALMAATPIVVGAAAAGRVVSNRLYHASLVTLLVGLAAWSTSRFATEDLQRGPLENLEAGERATRAFPDEADLLRAHVGGLELPRASQCAQESLVLARQHALPLVATSYGADMELLDAAALTAPGVGQEQVVVAAVDGRTQPSAIRAGLLRATQAGAQRVAVLTRYRDEESTLTLGALTSSQVCVAGWLPIQRVVEMVDGGAQWGTVAFAATRAERVRDARAMAEHP